MATSIAPPNITSLLLAARQAIDSSYAKLQHAEDLVHTHESMLGIEQRWTTEHPEYKCFIDESVKTNYREALTTLERLVVMCLFELSKLSMLGIGMHVSFFA